MYFLFWKNQRENSFWLLRSGVRLTVFFFLSFFFFFNSRPNTNMNTAKHQMFKVVSCWSSLQKLFSQLHLGGGCPCWFLATPSHIYIYIFFKVKVQPQLKLLSESGSKCLATEQKKVGRVTFSVALCPRFSEMITFWGLRGSSHFQVWCWLMSSPSGQQKGRVELENLGLGSRVGTGRGLGGA